MYLVSTVSTVSIVSFGLSLSLHTILYLHVHISSGFHSLYSLFSLLQSYIFCLYMHFVLILHVSLLVSTVCLESLCLCVSTCTCFKFAHNHNNYCSLQSLSVYQCLSLYTLICICYWSPQSRLRQLENIENFMERQRHRRKLERQGRLWRPLEIHANIKVLK